jgi:multicomponent Na+:H+ antiporter subunit G
MEILGHILILIGSILMFIGAIGCLKYKNFFHQLHAAAVGDNGGLLLILFGLMVSDGLTLFSAKIFTLIIIILLTSPTNTHLISKLAILSGISLGADKND